VSQPTDFDDKPSPEPAAAGSPPRKPPTAVGAPELPFESPQPTWQDPRSLGELIRQIAGSLAMPIHDGYFSSDTERQLRDAGIRTVADLLRVSDARMKRLGVDEPTRKFIVDWRRSLRLPTTKPMRRLRKP
jgi:hypothetical protein